MKFFAPVAAALLAATTVTAAGADVLHHLSKRDFGDIINNGIKIFADLDDLTAKLNAFNGDVPGALAVLNSTTTLSNDLKKTSDAVANTPTLTDDQGNLLASVVATLQTPIYNVIDLLATKRPQFQRVGGILPTGSIVLDRLRDLKNTTDIFGARLIPKLPANLQAVSPLLVSNIDYHYIRAIQLYQQFF